MPRIDSLAHLIRQAPWQLALLHSAPARRLIWITHGQGRIILSPKMRGLGVHNFLTIPPGAPFALDAGPGLNGHLLTLPEDDTGIWPDTPLLLRVRDAGPQGEIAGILEALIREQTNRRPLMEDALAAQVALLSVWLRRQLDLPEHLPEPYSAADRLADTLLQDIEVNHRTGAPMTKVAARLGITPTHLARVAKANLGRSAADLSADRSVHAARELLERTDYPAKSIAEGLGFGSAAAFSRFVSARTGKSPRALRKSARSTGKH